MSEQDRRRHHRYSLRLSTRLQRGSEQIKADIVNASASGCLLQVPVPMEPGELLGASIPELMIPEARLRVLRCQASPTGYMVATRFESLAADEPTLARLSNDQNELN
jgi:hypothetical protein